MLYSRIFQGITLDNVLAFDRTINWFDIPTDKPSDVHSVARFYNTVILLYKYHIFVYTAQSKNIYVFKIILCGYKCNILLKTF